MIERYDCLVVYSCDHFIALTYAYSIFKNLLHYIKAFGFHHRHSGWYFLLSWFSTLTTLTFPVMLTNYCGGSIFERSNSMDFGDCTRMSEICEPSKTPAGDERCQQRRRSLMCGDQDKVRSIDPSALMLMTVMSAVVTGSPHQLVLCHLLSYSFRTSKKSTLG